MNSTHHRIALVSGGLPLGGSTTFLCNLAGELVKRSIPCIVCSFEAENPFAEDFAKLGVDLHICDEKQMIFEDCMLSVLGRLRAFQPTSVIACLDPRSFEVLRYLPHGVERLGMIQSDDPNIYILLKRYQHWEDALVGVSSHIATKLRAFPEFSDKRVLCLPYGIPVSEAVPETTRPLDAPLRILYLGRLEQEQKRVRLFPEILRKLEEAEIPFSWTVAGDGSERAFLESEMKTGSRSGLHREITFAGALSYAAVPAMLRRHDIYLLASDYEGLPLSLLEAMSEGLVPVVSDLESGIREVVNSTNGILIDPADTKGYADAIVHLHKNRHELAAKSEQARERVREEFSVNAMTDRWLRALASPVEANAKTWAGSAAKVRPPLGGEQTFRFSPLGRYARKFRKLLQW